VGAGGLTALASVVVVQLKVNSRKERCAKSIAYFYASSANALTVRWQLATTPLAA